MNITSHSLKEFRLPFFEPRLLPLKKEGAGIMITREEAYK